MKNNITDEKQPFKLTIKSKKADLSREFEFKNFYHFTNFINLSLAPIFNSNTGSDGFN